MVRKIHTSVTPSAHVQIDINDNIDFQKDCKKYCTLFLIHLQLLFRIQRKRLKSILSLGVFFWFHFNISKQS